MAVIRAHRLWAVTLGPGLLQGQVLPSKFPTKADLLPDQRARVLIYQVPSGRKAIIRTMTHSLGGTLPSTEQGVFWVTIEPYNSGLLVDILWFWWWDFIAGWAEPIQKTFSLWNGQMVLSELDKVYVYNLSSQTLHTAGSGHEMPVSP